MELPRKIIDACRQQGNPPPAAREARCRPVSTPRRTICARRGARPGTGAAQRAGLHRLQPSVIFGHGDSFLSLFCTPRDTRPAAADWRRRCTLPAGLGGRRRPLLCRRSSAAAVHRPDLSAGRATGVSPAPAGRLRRARARPSAPDPGAAASAGMAAGRSAELLPGALLSRDNLASMQVPSVCADPFPAIFGFSPVRWRQRNRPICQCHATRPLRLLSYPGESNESSSGPLQGPFSLLATVGTGAPAEENHVQTGYRQQKLFVLVAAPCRCCNRPTFRSKKS